MREARNSGKNMKSRASSAADKYMLGEEPMVKRQVSQLKVLKC